MAKYSIEVQWHYKSFDYADIEVEADSMEEAKDKALAHAANHKPADWFDGQITGGEYFVNEDNCKEI